MSPARTARRAGRRPFLPQQAQLSKLLSNGFKFEKFPFFKRWKSVYTINSCVKGKPGPAVMLEEELSERGEICHSRRQAAGRK